MAADVFTIAGKVTLDINDAQSGLNKVSDSAEDAADGLDQTSESAKKAGSNVEDSGKKAKNSANDGYTVFKNVLSNLYTKVIDGVISKVGELVSSIAEIGTTTETAFAQLETIAGADNIDGLTESIKKLSTETGVSSADLATVAYNAISAGSSAEEAMDVVTAATKLGVAGFTDADSALSVLSTAMNSYGDSCGTVADISDSLIMVQNLGVTTIGQLSSSMGKAIATGSAYSVNLSNLESAYVSITKAGISTEESTTYLNSMLNELGDSGSDVSAILQEQTGKSFTQLMEDGNSLADVLGILYDACDGDSTALMNLWGSAEAGKASNAIVNQGLTEFNENLEAITGSSGATDEAYATMADTLETKTEIIKTKFEDAALSVYDAVEPVVSTLADFVINHFPAIINGIEILIALLPTLALSIKAIVTILDGGGFGWGYAAIITGIITVIITLVTVIVQNWDTIKNACSVALNAIAGFFSAAWEFIKNIFSTAWEFIKGVWGAVVDWFQGVWDGICGVFSAVGDWFSGVFSAAWEGIKSVWSAVTGFFQGIWESITNAFHTVIDPWVEIFKRAWALLKAEVDKVLAPVIEFFQNMWEQIKAVFVNVITFYVDLFTQAWEGIKAVWSAVSEFFQGIWDGIVTIFTPVIDWFGNIFSQAWEGIKTAWSAVGGFFSGIWDGIKNAFGSVSTWFKDTFSKAWEAVKNVFSTGGKIFDGIKDGIANVFKNIVNKIISGINRVIAVPFNAINKMLEKIKSITILGVAPFDWVNTFNVPQIPELAEGGVLERGQTAYLEGEGAEAVVPLEKNTGWIRRTAASLAEMLPQWSGANDANVADLVDKQSQSLVAELKASVTDEFNTKIDELKEQMAAFYELASNYFPLFASQQMVLDTGTLVGQLAPGIDTELGNIARRKSR